mgnify:CR=1 FL=1
MVMVFFVPCDFDSVQAAVAEVVRQMRWSHTFRYDELIPGWCEWDILDPLTQEEKGTIHLRKLGEGVRLSIPAVRDIANILVPMLQSLGIPIRPRKQLLPLGGSQGQASQNTRTHGTQGGTLDRAAEARSLIEAGVPKTKACKRAGIDVRTYDRYADLLVDWRDEAN